MWEVRCERSVRLCVLDGVLGMGCERKRPMRQKVYWRKEREEQSSCSCSCICSEEKGPVHDLVFGRSSMTVEHG